MERSYFSIDFLKPGKTLIPAKGWRIVLEKLDGFYQIFVKRLYRRVSTSVTFLTIGFVIAFLSGIAFYTQVYVPREDMLKSKSEEIKHMQQQVKQIKRELKQHQEQQKVRQERIAKLRELRQVNINWWDKLGGVQRSIVDDLWLTSLAVNDNSKPVTVILRGTSFGGKSDNEPLRLISDFMNNLVVDPSWNKSFALKDWHISTAAEDTGELVSFEMSLEGK